MGFHLSPLSKLCLLSHTDVRDSIITAISRLSTEQVKNGTREGCRGDMMHHEYERHIEAAKKQEALRK